MCIGTGLWCFLLCSKHATSCLLCWFSNLWNIGQESGVKRTDDLHIIFWCDTFWQAIVVFRVAYRDFVDYRDFAQHNGVTRKDLIDISFINQTVWQVLVHFWVVYCPNFQNIGHQCGLTWEIVSDVSTFRVWDRYLSDIDFSYKVFFDSSWCRFFKSVNHISDHSLKCLSKSLFSVYLSECDAKFLSASLLSRLKRPSSFETVK